MMDKILGTISYEYFLIPNSSFTIIHTTQSAQFFYHNLSLQF